MGLELPQLTYKVTEAKGRLAAEVAEDNQDLHNPDLRVRIDGNNGPMRDDTGKIVCYSGRQLSPLDKRFGDLTRFGGPIAHGVLSILPAMIGLTRLADRETCVVLEEGSANFVGPVYYNRTLSIAEWVINGQLGSKGRLAEGRTRLAFVCAIEDGRAVQGVFLVSLARSSSS